MTSFQRLFGIKESQVKNTCILLPLVRKDILDRLGVKDFSRGKLYGTGNGKHFTAIHTGIGPALLGDAILYLEKTRCQDIILFGSCGLVDEEKDMDIGSLVAPEKCYAMESFTDILQRNNDRLKAFHPDKTLLDKFPKVKKVTCATIGSLKLEEDYIDIFKQKQIHVVDMECSALFSASDHIKRKALALFYVTDIINKKPFYKGLGAADKLALYLSIKSAIKFLCEYIEKNLNV